MPRRRFFPASNPAAARSSTGDNRYFSRLSHHAEAAGIRTVMSFGASAHADARLVKCALHATCSTVEARIRGVPVTYKVGAPGHHLVVNSLAVLAVASVLGADLARAALALAELKPAAGRGTRIALELPGGPALLIDESYNANPASMRAALSLLAQAPIGPAGRRIAVHQRHARTRAERRKSCIASLSKRSMTIASIWSTAPGR